MSTEEALLPCPFCGGVAETIWNYTENCLETKCSNCSTYFREGNDREEAIKAWNSRAQPEGQVMWAGYEAPDGTLHNIGPYVMPHGVPVLVTRKE